MTLQGVQERLREMNAARREADSMASYDFKWHAARFELLLDFARWVEKGRMYQEAGGNLIERTDEETLDAMRELARAILKGIES